MKSRFFSMVMAATLFIACSTNNGTQEQTLAVDSVAFMDSTKTADVKIMADWPTDNTAALTGIIREYINEELGGTYEGDLKDSKAMMAFYGGEVKKNLEDMAKADDRPDAPALIEYKSVTKTYETDRLVVYTSCTETYYGGAHGMHTATTGTFRKADGRRFGMEMFVKTETEGFRALIKDGLKEYFSEDAEGPVSDEMLKDMLLTDYTVDFLPLPQFPPHPDKDGITFTYQPYEIAPYAAGMPAFTVPYDKIKPYLTVTARRLVE